VEKALDNSHETLFSPNTIMSQFLHSSKNRSAMLKDPKYSAFFEQSILKQSFNGEGLILRGLKMNKGY